MQLNQTCTPSLKDSKAAPAFWMTEPYLGRSIARAH